MDNNTSETPSTDQKLRVLRRRIRVIVRAFKIVVITSFIYDLSFAMFGLLSGDSIVESFISQFSIRAWIEFWSHPVGAAIFIVYVAIFLGTWISILKPRMWTGNYANPYTDD